MDNKLLQT